MSGMFMLAIFMDIHEAFEWLATYLTAAYEPCDICLN